MAVPHDPAALLDAFPPTEMVLHAVQTIPLLEPDLWGPRAPTGILIAPPDGSQWNLLKIAILLNELDQTWHPGKSARLTTGSSRTTKDDRYLRFLFECDDTLLERWLEVKIFLPSWAMEVQAAREWVQIEWTAHEIVAESTGATQHRSIQRARERKYTQCAWEVTMTKDATRSIAAKAPLLFFEKRELSKCIKYFARVLVKNGLPRTRNFAFAHDIDVGVNAKHQSRSITTLFEFEAANQGYLRLTVSSWRECDTGRFERLTLDGKRYSVLKGCYVAPFAYSLLRDSADVIAGLLMDTTWKIIRLYVASILTVVVGNVGVPIALSFGPAENNDLYDTFYATFRSLFNLDLSIYVVESDQGPALRSICTQYHNRHLAYLRHLLVFLGAAHSHGRLAISSDADTGLTSTFLRSDTNGYLPPSNPRMPAGSERL
jgi:hypothetical protein